MPHLLISAGPGCGKTYSLVNAWAYVRATNRELFRRKRIFTEEQLAIYEWCAKNLPQVQPDKCVFLAFSTSAQAKMEAEIQETAKCYTVNGAGYAAIMAKNGYIKLEDKAGRYHVERITGMPWSKLETRNEWFASIKHLEALKQECNRNLSYESLEFVHDKYPELGLLPIHPRMIEQCAQLIKSYKTLDKTIGITYKDQIWLALWETPRPIYKIGFVDEVQDLSHTQLMLCRRLCENLVMAGDENQSIMAFNGADAHAFQFIKEFATDQLPLRTTFRLPILHTANVNAHTPSARLVTAKKEKGTESRITQDECVSLLAGESKFSSVSDVEIPNSLDSTSPSNSSSSSSSGSSQPPSPIRGALIVARTNARLIHFSLKLAKAGVAHKILGDSLVHELIGYMSRSNAETCDRLIVALDAAITNCKLTGYSRMMHLDKLECIKTIAKQFSAFDPVKMAELKLRQMFSSQVDHITLCTMHKSKGLEHENVMILLPVECSFATSPDEQAQEHNLMFVAKSRVAANLYWVEPPVESGFQSNITPGMPAQYNP